MLQIPKLLSKEPSPGAKWVGGLQKDKYKLSRCEGNKLGCSFVGMRKNILYQKGRLLWQDDAKIQTCNIFLNFQLNCFLKCNSLWQSRDR